MWGIARRISARNSAVSVGRIRFHPDGRLLIGDAGRLRAINPDGRLSTLVGPPGVGFTPMAQSAFITVAGWTSAKRGNCI